MSKSILIIDTPEDCYSCDLCKEDNQTYRPYCSINYRDIFYTPEKPDWCPLQPIPEKHEIGVNSRINPDKTSEILKDLKYNLFASEFTTDEEAEMLYHTILYWRSNSNSYMNNISPKGE